MHKFFVSAIALAIAPVSLAVAKPASSQSAAPPPAACPTAKKGQASPEVASKTKQHSMDHASGHKMQHGNHAAMNHGQDHAMMHGDSRCQPAPPQKKRGG